MTAEQGPAEQRPSARPASDMFLGWTSYRGHDYYVRQFKDMKGTVNLDAMTLPGFASYAQVCGRTLARAHARSGDAAMISGYLGSGSTFDQAIARFADSYAETVTADYDELAAGGAVGSGPGGPGVVSRTRHVMGS